MDYKDLLVDIINEQEWIRNPVIFVDKIDSPVEGPLSNLNIENLVRKITNLVPDHESYSYMECWRFNTTGLFDVIIDKFPEEFNSKEILHIVLSSLERYEYMNWHENPKEFIENDPWLVSLVELLEAIENKDAESVLMWKLKN